jgi:hypothetical protein
LISDVHLRFNGAYSGDAFSEVIEQVFGTGFVLLNKEDLVVSNPPPVFEDVYWLDQPSNKILVVKDVILYAEGHRRLSHASISTIDQTFSQIPEPGTVLLVAAGLFGLILTGRRSHK